MIKFKDILDEVKLVPHLNINDKSEKFTSQILSGEKTIETRNIKSLHPYIGKRVGIVRTGKGVATLVGYVTVGHPIFYKDNTKNTDSFSGIAGNFKQWYLAKRSRVPSKGGWHTQNQYCL